ncbi:HlyD family secretion protein [Aureimonas sp. ME7]|uniref:HlyD family secretion protein n=1 Tax=Aureimonas sp. ME7 TaxID=2744252 RepID=UPI0015F6B43F|nr:HlyD family secretion protein [Aureimonas sp. ME7]
MSQSSSPISSAPSADDRASAPRLEVVGRKGGEDAPQAAATQSAKTDAPKKKGIGKRLVLPVVVIAALAGGGWYGHQWWVDGRFLVSTDDAYVGADMAVLTPKVTGYIQSLPVVENQHVKAGDTIAVIDPGDYQLALRSAEAKIETQNASIARIRAQRDAAVAQVSEARANETAAESSVAQTALDLERADRLVRSGAGAQAPLDQARSAKAEADARLAGTKAASASAEANVSVLDAQIAEAQTTLGSLAVERDQANRDLGFTTIRAPYDGVIGNLSVQEGDLVSPSRRLAAVVPLDRVYVDANFKETQLHEIAVGEKVRIEVDALPGHDVTGTVVSLAPASGSVFSLLPADNATGNFTKIVQRVPVRIAIDPSDAAKGNLRPGLSVTAAVDTRTAPDGAAELAEAAR